jgi:hypothetical protein
MERQIREWVGAITQELDRASLPGDMEYAAALADALDALRRVISEISITENDKTLLEEARKIHYTQYKKVSALIPRADSEGTKKKLQNISEILIERGLI